MKRNRREIEILIEDKIWEALRDLPPPEVRTEIKYISPEPQKVIEVRQSPPLILVSEPVNQVTIVPPSK